MAQRRILTVQEDSTVLRARAAPVRRINSRIRLLMDDMVETMRQAPGVGLAAPQVGVSLRVICVEVPLNEDPKAPPQLYTLANPEILWAAEETEEGEEACLSVPGLVGDVPRAVTIRVRGLNRRGRPVELKLQGFAARVFQHEIDHLDGILFPDRVTSLDKLFQVHTDENGQLVRVPYSAAAVL